MTLCTQWVESRRKLRDMCGGTIHEYRHDNPADDFDKCERCGATWSRDSKEEMREY